MWVDPQTVHGRGTFEQYGFPNGDGSGFKVGRFGQFSCGAMWYLHGLPEMGTRTRRQFSQNRVKWSIPCIFRPRFNMNVVAPILAFWILIMLDRQWQTHFNMNAP